MSVTVFVWYGLSSEGGLSYLIILLVGEVLILLHDLVQPPLDAVLAAAERVDVVVQQAVHVGALHHLHQDGGQLAFQRQQSLRGSGHAQKVTHVNTHKHSSHTHPT